jgi:hypothetical protein
MKRPRHGSAIGPQRAGRIADRIESENLRRADR